ILSANGQIRFFLGDVDIIVKQKDVVGNIIQEWLGGWLRKREIEFDVSTNTQTPPDFFFLNKKGRSRELWEVKAFNRNACPGFDIADFKMYSDEIIHKPYMLDVDYLIFGYDMDDNGNVTIKDLWLKQVWQITRSMDGWAINLQVKKGVVHKIRPGVWY
ncbi:NgoBV family restriction endonuclease, partial [Klebsiella pneumoniae]|uniref:NgoBV family restriction endonuclease n=1 Tax=Klebsiella pneumoniae TaxID=573 RepID=UPI0021D08E39